jgi:hypothetical protein
MFSLYVFAEWLGRRAGEEMATGQDFAGRLVFGLYGNAAPYAVQQFLQ